VSAYLDEAIKRLCQEGEMCEEARLLLDMARRALVKDEGEPGKALDLSAAIDREKNSD